MTAELLTQAATAAPHCITYGCDSAHEATPKHRCRDFGFHQGRVWTLDTYTLNVQVSPVSYIEGCDPDPAPLTIGGEEMRDHWTVLLTIRDMESDDSIVQSMSLADLDAIIGHLVRAREDVARWAKP